VLLLETRRDYFTDQAHGHVAILAVAREAEGQGVGQHCSTQRMSGDDAAASAADPRRLRRQRHAKGFYARLGWRTELETLFKTL